MRTSLAGYGWAVSFLLLTFFLGGCGGGAPEVETIHWPPPPAKPVIAYEGVIHGSHDLPRGFWSRLGDSLFGGSPDHDLGKPYGLFITADSHMLVADTSHKVVMDFDLKKGGVKLIESLGPHGTLLQPVNAIADQAGNIYVADTWLKRVVVFDRDRKFSRFIGQDVLESPVGMAVDEASGLFYVADSGRHQVVIFSLDGELKGEFGGRGDQQGEFYHPLGMRLLADGRIMVVDSFHFAVQIFDATGKYVDSFGPTRKGMGSLARPRALDVDSDGNIYVTDALRNNVQIFDQQGQFQMDFGRPGFDPGQFRLPAGIFITPDDRIFVVDSINHRIQIFRYLGMEDAQ
jgi:DNA-binding beta-propeller fold protein YncE